MLVLEACGKRGSSLWTTKRTKTFLDNAEPSSRARRTNFRASSCMAVRGTKISIIACTQKWIIMPLLIKAANPAQETGIPGHGQQPTGLKRAAEGSDAARWARWRSARQESGRLSWLWHGLPLPPADSGLELPVSSAWVYSASSEQCCSGPHLVRS